MFALSYNYRSTFLALLNADGSRGLSVDQLKGKQLSPMFGPDAVVVFRAKVLSIL